MEKQPSIVNRILGFIAYSNLFISICAASVALYAQLLFLGRTSLFSAWITFGTTFVLYNTQQLFLGYIALPDQTQRKIWARKNRALLQLVFLVGIAEVYPLSLSSWQFLITYAIAGVISLLYFLPFSNLRAIPFLKSLIIGFVWVLICILAPLDPQYLKRGLLYFCLSQLCFITALCILFNIRDVEQDREMGTYTLPVLYGEKVARGFAYVLLFGYLTLFLVAGIGRGFWLVAGVTFLTSCFFTARATRNRHPFYYLLGVDGLILLQSIIGIVLLRL